MKLTHLTAAAFALLTIPAASALAGSEDYIGEVSTVAGNFCPSGTLPAIGQLMQIRQYQALYSLLGSTYGGDGQVTFALPNIPPTKTVQGAALTTCIAITGVYPRKDGMMAKHPAEKK
jgi:microcystin-dependent protein